MNLNEHGGACRCLLRLREDLGEPGLSDGMFISQHIARYPDWQERPGAVDLSALCELAKALKLADRVEVFREYDRVLFEHRAGQRILMVTERIPDQGGRALVVHRYVALVLNMDESRFTVWCPFPSGQSDILPAAAPVWWDKWLAVGVILYRS